jgi:membrane fusion protein (multidrug efflux system)
MEVYFSMSEKDLLEMTKASGGANAAIQNLPAVKLMLADGSIYNHEGRVTKVSGVIDQSTGSVSMIAQFPNPERLLKSGGSGSIVIPRNNANAIVIPQSCVMEVQDKHFVYVLQDSIVNYTEIVVEPQNDGRNYVVTSGLKIGDKYVTNGITKLQDKMVIKPITPEQYEQKMKEAEGLGAAQGDASKLKEIFSK